MGIDVDGDAAAAAEFRRLARKYPEATALALYAEGFRVQRAAMIKTPREYGFLESGAYTAPPKKQGGEWLVEVGYGAIYARVQHEGINFRHPRKGEAKFLEKGFLESMVGFAPRMAKRIRELVEAGASFPPSALGPTRPGPSKPPRRPKKPGGGGGKSKGRGLKRPTRRT